jgi:hypothetical protein
MCVSVCSKIKILLLSHLKYCFIFLKNQVLSFFWKYCCRTPHQVAKSFNKVSLRVFLTMVNLYLFTYNCVFLIFQMFLSWAEKSPLSCLVIYRGSCRLLSIPVSSIRGKFASVPHVFLFTSPFTILGQYFREATCRSCKASCQ